MEEPQRARSHTVTTTASSFAENFSTSSSSFAYDREFLRTLPGLLIVAEIVSAERAGGGRRGRRRGTRAACLRGPAAREPFWLRLAFFPECTTPRAPLRARSDHLALFWERGS